MLRSVILLAAGCAALGACSKTDEPSADKKTPPPAPSPSASGPSMQERLAAQLRDAGLEVRPHSGKLVKDNGGHYVPTTPPPPVDSSQLPPTPTRDPDPDLDPDDPARDYVTRYVKGINRYGDKTACVVVGKSTDAGAPKRLVEVRDNKEDPKCGGSDTLRDAFVVDVGADRMSKKDPKLGEPLKPWPDGSDPEAPAKPPISVDDLKAQWKTPLQDEIKKLKLTPIRVQMYGRGTYPVITLAGFREPFKRDARADDMKDAVERLCAAGNNTWMSFLGGIDRSTTLRLRCNPPSARWDKF